MADDIYTALVTEPSIKILKNGRLWVAPEAKTHILGGLTLTEVHQVQQIVGMSLRSTEDNLIAAAQAKAGVTVPDVSLPADPDPKK